MGASWYVRVRGRQIGPLTADQLRDMQQLGQVQGYHEVTPNPSAPGSWKAIDLVPEFAPPRPPAATPATAVAKAVPAAPAAKGRKAVALVVAAAVGLLAVGVGGIGILVLRNRAGGDNPGGDDPRIITLANLAPSERQNMLTHSVGLVVCGVSIRWEDGETSEFPEFGTGSGFLVTHDGHVFTNRHVVKEYGTFQGSQLQKKLETKLRATVSPKVWVFFGRDAKYEAEVLHISENYDFAVLKTGQRGKRFFALCDVADNNTPPLDGVDALGYPAKDRKATKILTSDRKDPQFSRGAPIQRHFEEPDFNFSREHGVVKRAAFRSRPDLELREVFVLAHTARISGGNSGGPLVARDGTVIGINTLGISTSIRIPGMIDLKLDQEGQNFAITLPQLRTEVEQHAPGVVWRVPSEDR